MSAGIQTALALSLVALAALYLGSKALGIARAFLSAASGRRGGGSCGGGCGGARRGKPKVEVVRFPPRTQRD